MTDSRRCGGVLAGALASGDVRSYWARRDAFLTLIPYLRAFHTVTASRVPKSLASELDELVSTAERAIPRKPVNARNPC
ncbi:hypothetical protein ND748_05140 [Frankia sp. AiPs1]|uniref:hypothetical protein n=1 Tax=Frankia sp. AiPs1 TaxID=573493 RepID=UPI0020446BFF|nr:hypothetical protein [Frankia sp. AiPs1]MCM3921063.1 hypothetical protein [Frankia sp. AiPs1]